MTFIKCKNCDMIIAVKDLQADFSPNILAEATAQNTITGPDLCMACAIAQQGAHKASEIPPEEKDLEGKLICL